MKTFKSAVLCMAVFSTATVSVLVDDGESKLPQLKDKEVLVLNEANHLSQPIDVGAYGKLPEGAVLPPPSSLSIQDQARVLARQTRAGGKAGFLALLQALRLSGIEITSLDGVLSPADKRNQGLTLSITSLQVAADELANTSSIPLSDYMGGAAGFLTHTDEQTFGPAFVAGVQKMASSKNPALRFFVSYVDALNVPDKDSVSLLRGDADQSKTPVTPLQMALLGTRLAAEFSVHFHHEAAAPSFAAVPSAPSSDCLQKAGETIKEPTVVSGDQNFDETIKITANDSADNPDRAMKNADNLANFLRLNPAALKAIDFLVSVGAREKLPLIRTKTTSKGERKTLFVEFTPAFTQDEYSKCLLEFTSVLGLRMKKNPNDPEFFENMKADLLVEKVFGVRRLVFDDAGSMATTLAVNAKGKAETPVYGAPQKQNLPANVKPNLMNVPVKVKYEAPVVNYFDPVPGQEQSEAAVRGLIRLDNASKGKRTKVVEVAVQDWIGKAEGSVTVHVDANYHVNAVSSNKTKYTQRKTDFDFTLDETALLLPESHVLPPMGSYPGLPPQYSMPQLQAVIMNNVTGFSVFSRLEKNRETCSDPCDPNEKGERSDQKTMVETFSFGKVEPKSNSVFLMPWSIDTKAKVIKIQMMVPMPNKVGIATLVKTAKKCDGSPDADTGKNAQAPINVTWDVFHTLNLEVPYTEENGMAVAKQAFVKDFGYHKNVAIPIESLTLILPASLEIKVDVRIPLP